MPKRFQSYNMQTKILITTYLITLVPTIILFVFLNIGIKKLEFNDYQLNCEQRVNSASEEINQKFYVMVDRASNISTNTDIVRVLKKEEWTNLNEIYRYYKQLDEFLVGYISPYNEQRNQILIYPIKNILPESKYMNRIEKLQQRPIWNEISEKLNKDCNYIWECSETDGVEYISLYKGIMNYNQPLGYVEIRIPFTEIKDVLKKMQLYDGEVIQYKNTDGTCIYQNKNYAKKMNYVKENTLISGGIIRIEIATSEIHAQKRYYIIIYLLLFLIAIIAIYCFYKGLVRSIMKELYGFIKQLKDTDEFLLNEELINIESENEISVIKQSFKDLIIHKKEIYEQLMESNKKKQQLRFELLQSGINPHLLYNSLSVFKWRMLRQKQTDMVNIIDSMTAYYRKVLSGGDCIITIKDELELVTNYIKINEFCYGNQYSVTIDMDDTLMDCYTIKLIMQPFVENAVMHGLNGIKNGQIKLEVKRKECMIVFRIIDNGFGMTNETIQKIFNNEYQARYAGYGIKNTNNRIKLYYGEEYGVSISSVLGEGTTVEIVIPYENEAKQC